MSVLATTPLSMQPTQPAAAVRPAKAEPDPGLVEAARQFEAIFVRKLLSALEKSPSLTGKSQAGSGIYGSMITSSLAEQATQGDGLGLSALVLEALSSRASPLRDAKSSVDGPAGPTGIPK